MTKPKRVSAFRKELACLAGAYPSYDELVSYLRDVLKGVKVETERPAHDTHIHVTGTRWQHRRAADILHAWRAGLQASRRNG